jgi:hypothetical protein
MALDITYNLKRFDAADPVKYDFALCRLGMLSKSPKSEIRGPRLNVQCPMSNVQRQKA